jgi:transposase-like protein
MAGKTQRIGLSLIDTAKVFATEENCHLYLETARWPEGVRCIKCNHDKVSKFTVEGKTRVNKNGETKTGPDRFMYQCLSAECRYQFQTTTGTIFGDTHLPLSKWMMAVALMCNAKKGLSAKQMERDLGVSYKTAWYLCHRIRKAMDEGVEGMFTGTAEMDETYVGGRYDERRSRAKYDKAPVFGMVERETGRVSAKHVRKINAKNLHAEIERMVITDARVMTDESKLYSGLAAKGFAHEMVNHSGKEWVRGDVSTQAIEGFWSLLKRGIIDSFHQVSVKHLDRYIGEFQFRFNNRADQDIFAAVVIALAIKSGIRYADLTASEEHALACPLWILSRILGAVQT